MTTPLQPPTSPGKRPAPHSHRQGSNSLPQYPVIPSQQIAPPAGLEGPPAPPHGRKRHWIRNAFIGLAGVFVLLIVIGAMAGPTTPEPQAATPDAPAADPPPAPVAPVETPATAIGSWYRGGGGSRMDAMIGDFRASGNASSGGDLAGLNSACESLQADVESAQAYSPIPDAQAQTHWSAALAQEARAASDCIAGISSRDLDLISKSGGEVMAGAAQMVKVTARMNALGGK